MPPFRDGQEVLTMNLLELGDLTAQWLEGTIAVRPGDGLRDRPDPETTDLIPILARLCRVGYVTSDSQPHSPASAGYDGAVWRQRAAVQGIIAEDHELLPLLLEIARERGLIVITNRSSGWRSAPAVTVTERAGRPVTAFGGRARRRDLRLAWGDYPNLRPVYAAVQVTIIDPDWGRPGLLWETLMDALDAWASSRLGYSDHDPDLMGWGVAEEDPADGTLRVRAYRSHDDADRAADPAPRLVVEGRHPSTGAPCRIPDVSPLVWHHDTEGWTLAAVGWPVSDARRA